MAQQQELEAKQQEMLKQLQLQEADVAEKVAYREKISQVLTEWKVAVARITQEQESLATSQERMEADLKEGGLTACRGSATSNGVSYSTGGKSAGRKRSGSSGICAKGRA